MTGRSNTILIPHSPGHMTDLTEQIRNAMMTAEQLARVSAGTGNGNPHVGH